MKPTLTILSLFLAVSAMAQTPKQHIKYDTVNTVQKRIVYDPDTIAVYFKEVVTGNQIYEAWNYGYVVWQTYNNYGDFTFGYGGGISFGSDTSYVSNPYPFSQTPPGRFLYMNKKPVTNKVIFCIKR